MKHNRLKFGLRWKLNLLMGAVVLITMGLFEGLGLYGERQILINARAQYLAQLTQQLAWILQSSSDQNLQNLLMNYERGLNGELDRGQRAVILNARSRVVAATNPQLVGTVMDQAEAFQTYRLINTDTPARVYVQNTTRMFASLSLMLPAADPRSESQPLTVTIAAPLDDIRGELRRSLLTHLVHLIVTAVALAIVTNIALSMFVLKPIRRLLAGMRRMERGTWTDDIPVKTTDEIGRLTRGYNVLGRNLEIKVRCLVRAEKLASVALAAIHWNRPLQKPVERIRGSAEYLCRNNAFDSESAHAVGKIFDQTDRILAISEKFNRDFATQVESEGSSGEKSNSTSQHAGVSPGQPQAKASEVVHI